MVLAENDASSQRFPKPCMILNKVSSNVKVSEKMTKQMLE